MVWSVICCKCGAKTLTITCDAKNQFNISRISTVLLSFSHCLSSNNSLLCELTHTHILCNNIPSDFAALNQSTSEEGTYSMDFGEMYQISLKNLTKYF